MIVFSIKISVAIFATHLQDVVLVLYEIEPNLFYSFVVRGIFSRPSFLLFYFSRGGKARSSKEEVPRPAVVFEGEN